VLVAALNVARGDFEIPVLDVLAVFVGGGDLLLSFGLRTPADRRRHRPRPRLARRPLPGRAAAHGDRAARGGHGLGGPDRLRRARRAPGLPAAGRRGPAPLFASAVYGALLLVAADLVTRTALPVELPVGIVASAIGAPSLIWMLARGARA